MRMYRQGPEFEKRSIDEIFSIMEKCVCDKKIRVYGNVHGVSMNIAKEIKRKDFYVGQITRNPITRLHSFVTLWKYEYETFDLRREQIERQFRDLASSLEEIRLESPCEIETLEDRLFVIAPFVLIPNDSYLLREDIPIWRFEDITGNIDCFISLFSALTQGSVDVNNSFIESVKDIGVQNSFIEDRKSDFDLYSSWKDWQKELVTRVISKYGLFSVYEGLGYDLSFARNPRIERDYGAYR